MVPVSDNNAESRNGEDADFSQIGACVVFDVLADTSVDQRLAERRMSPDKPMVGIVSVFDDGDLELASAIPNLFESNGATDTNDRGSWIPIHGALQRLNRHVVFAIFITSRFLLTLHEAEEVISRRLRLDIGSCLGRRRALVAGSSFRWRCRRWHRSIRDLLVSRSVFVGRCIREGRGCVASFGEHIDDNRLGEAFVDRDGPDRIDLHSIERLEEILPPELLLGVPLAAEDAPERPTGAFEGGLARHVPIPDFGPVILIAVELDGETTILVAFDHEVDGEPAGLGRCAPTG